MIEKKRETQNELNEQEGHIAELNFITDATGYAVQHLQYLPFGEQWINQQSGSFDSRYKFSAKEQDDETSYTYFGARYYDSDLSVWLSVDAMSDNTPGVSPYAYCINNPVIIVDPDGNDWFMDEETGDVHYNSSYGKDDAAKVGANYKWMGANDMFGYTEDEMKDAAYDRNGSIYPLADYIQTYTNTDIDNNSTIVDEAHFSGENAVKFMGLMGYKKAPTQAIQFTLESQSFSVGPGGRSISWTTKNITQINEKYTYIPYNDKEQYSYNLSDVDYKYIPPLSSATVSRVGFCYSSGTSRQFVNKAMEIAKGATGTHVDVLKTVYPNWSSYPGNITMINNFVKNH
ncbi:hypothetical protein SDC9_65780 [bioreactor metagenome]|uniref:RHS repeat-associated core domain-containing protein n=1 Tax=bioreactor metagenome TaxID=1076179 RepID=A0A644XTW1_9ZZZZ